MQTEVNKWLRSQADFYQEDSFTGELIHIVRPNLEVRVR